VDVENAGIQNLLIKTKAAANGCRFTEFSLPQRIPLPARQVKGQIGKSDLSKKTIDIA
jgi:hypothetical protein